MFNHGTRNILLTPFLIWAGLFIFIPLICIVWYGVTGYDGKFSLANMGLIFERGYMDALKLSIWLALISTVICLLLAYPLCLILTERQRDNTTIISLLYSKAVMFLPISPRPPRGMIFSFCTIVTPF